MSISSLDDSKAVEKLKKIKLFILDVDGILTDCRASWSQADGWTRTYCIYDGFGTKLLMQNGIQVAVISAGNSQDVRERCAMLNIKDVYLGSENKIVAYEKLVAEKGVSHEQCLYMGDELFDIPILEKVGFAASVPTAWDYVKEKVHYVTERLGGYGAVREVIEGTLKAQRLGHYS